MATENANQKAVSLANMQRAVNEIKKDYAKKDEVTKQIAQAALGGITFASDSEILALFEDESKDSD